MEDGGKSPTLRCEGGAPRDKTVINRIMLSFRPIAPKPASAGDSTTGGSQLDNKNLPLCKPRSKRKYIRVNRCRRKKGISSDQERDRVTLQLLPEKTESNDGRIDLNQAVSSTWSEVILHENRESSAARFNSSFDDRQFLWEPDLGVAMRERRVVKVESRVTVESVTGACMEERGLGVTDEERVRNLERDTCPGFVSDGQNRVVWVNEAYKRMLMGSKAGNGSVVPEITVWLVLKAGVPGFRSAFSCSVRVQYAWQERKCSGWGAVPCDAWPMDGGGFAWRLDIEAALSLGR